MNVPHFARRAIKLITRNSGKILTWTRRAGYFITTGLAIEATWKAKESLDDLKIQTGRELRDIPKKDIIKTVAPHYVPTALSLGVTVAADVGSSKIAEKETAALASLYSASEFALKEYKDKVAEKIGEKKEKALSEELAVEKIKQHPPTEATIEATGTGDQLCYDPWCDRYFTSSLEHIQRVEVAMNKRILSEMWVTWNEVYSEIGLRPSKFGESIGWNVDNMIEFAFSSCIGDDGRTYLVVDHYNRPVTFTGNEQL